MSVLKRMHNQYCTTNQSIQVINPTEKKKTFKSSIIPCTCTGDRVKKSFNERLLIQNIHYLTQRNVFEN